MYICIDPGDTVGWATFSRSGKLVTSGQTENFLAFGEVLESILSEGVWTRVLYESFKIFPNRPLGGSEVPAAQCIGMIRYLCGKANVPCEAIDPKYKKIGYAWAAIKKPTNHAYSHKWDAIALGEYWLRKNGIKPNDAP